MILPSELIELINKYTDLCTQISFRVTCKDFTTLPTAYDVELQSRLKKMKKVLGSNYSYYFLLNKKIKTSILYAIMGYANCYFEWNEEKQPSGFLAACVSGSLEIAQTCTVYSHDQIHSSILLCCLFNQGQVYKEFLSKYMGLGDEKKAAEIYASGRKWLNSHYRSRKRINTDSFDYAIQRRNHDLIRKTIPKRVKWNQVIKAGYLKEEFKQLYDLLIKNAYRQGNVPSVYTIMRLDDTDLYLRWTNGKDYLCAALEFNSYRILRLMEIKGDTLLERCQSAYEQGCTFKDRGFIAAVIQEGDLEVLRFIVQVIDKEFIQSLLSHAVPGRKDQEFLSFLTTNIPSYRDNPRRLQ